MQENIPPSMGARLRGRWLAAARAAWVAAALLILGLFIASLAPYYHDLSVFSIGQINDPTAIQIGLGRLGLSAGAYAAYILTARVIFVIVYAVVALLIFARGSDDRVALLFSFTLIASGVVLANTLDSLAHRYPASLLSTLTNVIVLYGGSAVFIFCYLFPDGRFVPRWTRLAAIAFILVEAALLYLHDSPFDPNTWPIGPRLAVYGAMFGSCLFAPIYRYRRVSSLLQRQQIKWAVFGFTAAVGGSIGLIASLLAYYLLMPERPPGIADVFIEVVGVTLYLLFLLAVPVTVAVAVLRYRLWDIDIIVNRTLVYGALTAALALVYAASVIIFQATFRALTGEQQSRLVTVVSTLLIVALFTPLRRRTQTIIDRRFYRHKYDSAKMLAAFGAKMRDEVDLKALADDLLAIIEETMQPAHVSLWLRPDPAPRRETRR